MAKSCTNSDTDRPRNSKDSNERDGDPRLNLLGYLVSIAEGLEARGLDLLFFSFSLKHGFSLVAQERFHQDELVPNAGPPDYQGSFLEPHGALRSSPVVNEVLPTQHLHLLNN